jgi:hypothetical protein
MLLQIKPKVSIQQQHTYIKDTLSNQHHTMEQYYLASSQHSIFNQQDINHDADLRKHVLRHFKFNFKPSQGNTYHIF